ncbi:MAG: NADP-dependent methylenetetrahydromethanopterin/methylenetetrahydrofolate dehydrogenase [Gammaproteobacteria bacterium]|nr:NADP-dependent methylenetetrahydromethanopterin/methylenetetrahydrofolate dehydrogenase [Gammaproteobacteria bacterium]MCY4210502.1 NADP-dependent methylenetetrahydromethanopterin/methylenetetrahydrofolate dehydrogenase [Gammaproteobacteria bacterium]MCY4283485.1 NADP-dependent methylenetetrahydromethanopterin/methylenetetrahydrofolate dehydrogenase [Gammaproteobacteria bacterium]MCY4337264.1 NADP-dependent methylenetetrahydromethanopterin/methylenetetrahydrofolate dehydrogenase [Gammaproteob
MKKLLFQLDTDPHAAVFDTVVGYDGGADHVIGHGGCTPDNVRALVDGAIFTRSPKEKKNTALFIGGSDMVAGEQLLDAVQQVFFANFRVSVMLDSNGSNTTAAAAAAKLLGSGGVTGKKVVILGGTGPVGQRAAVMLTREGAEVVLCSRGQARADAACTAIKDRFGVDVTALGTATDEDRADAVADAQIVIATGAAGVQLLAREAWENNPSIEMLADANATPPLGIAGVDMMDRGEVRSGKTCWGAIGFGTLKLALHRACIARLFESNDQVFDAEEIFALAKTMG